MPFKSEKQRKWMWANEPEMAEKWEDEEDEIEEGLMRITKRQLRSIIRESLQELGKGWQLSRGECDTHNISPAAAAEAMAVLGEFGYSLFIPPSVDDNQVAINDALAAYPGEYSYEDFLCAIRVTQGRGA